MKPSILAGLLLMVLTAACTQPSKPLAIPDLSQVDHVVVSRWKDSSRVWAYSTEDRRRIAALLAQLRKHNTGYRVNSSLYVQTFNPGIPAHEYEIGFMSLDGLPLSVHIGADWLGGRDGLEDFPGERRRNLYRQRSLSASEHKAFTAILEPVPAGGEDLYFFQTPPDH